MTEAIKCPTCGSETRLRKSKKDGRKFYVCVNYPHCQGRVAFDDEWEEEPSPISNPKREASPLTVIFGWIFVLAGPFLFVWFMTWAFDNKFFVGSSSTEIGLRTTACMFGCAFVTIMGAAMLRAKGKKR